MVQLTPLFHVNGGEPKPEGVQCAHCGTWLGSERAIANTPGGPRFFCKMEPEDNPQDSCYLQWRLLRN